MHITNCDQNRFLKFARKSRIVSADFSKTRSGHARRSLCASCIQFLLDVRGSEPRNTLTTHCVGRDFAPPLYRHDDHHGAAGYCRRCSVCMYTVLCVGRTSGEWLLGSTCVKQPDYDVKSFRFPMPGFDLCLPSCKMYCIP